MWWRFWETSGRMDLRRVEFPSREDKAEVKEYQTLKREVSEGAGWRERV